MTEFETTKLLSEPCPDCGNNTLLLGVELIGGKAIDVQYQIYCENEDECGFTHNPEWIDKVYTTRYSSVDEAKQEAIERAYKAGLEQFQKDF